ncbi:MAG: hypothetical protein P8L78_16340 [Mariniblastus sp.]|nr:hypothetical protein [Mariniblastus sp.]
MKQRPLHMCVDAGPQRQTLAVLMICPRHRKEKASGTNVSRGFCSRADWIRTSDLYTPSVTTPFDASSNTSFIREKTLLMQLYYTLKKRKLVS